MRPDSSVKSWTSELSAEELYDVHIYMNIKLFSVTNIHEILVMTYHT